MWYMKCPKCGKSVNKNPGKPYKEDIKTKGWKTVTRIKINYDCSSCDWTKTETEEVN